jgi:hypothetical protein
VESCEQLNQLLDDARKDVSELFGIELPAGIKVKYVNTAFINGFREGFVPTPYFDDRSVGLAVFPDMVLVENGTPERSCYGTIVHELVHIWQFANLNYSQLIKDFENYLIEGHTTLVQIEALKKKYPDRDWKSIIAPLNRNDEYGDGYRMLKSLMAKSGGASLNNNPFEWLLQHYPKNK